MRAMAAMTSYEARRQDDPDGSGMPRWVKVALVIALALALLFVVARVTGVGGEHGPGRHSRSDDTPPSIVDGQDRHRSPVEHRP